MNGFLWASGHLGWGIFALATFTCLWWLLTDWVWRLKSVSVGRLLAIMSSGWIAGVGAVILTYWLVNR